jgi:hypothetical protein
MKTKKTLPIGIPKGPNNIVNTFVNKPDLTKEDGCVY